MDGSSAPEAVVLVLIHHGEELIEEHGFRMRLVGLPLGIRSFPENLPAVHGADVCCLRDGTLDLLSLVAPERPDGENLHALPFDAPGEVHLMPQVFSRTAAKQEVRHGGLDVGGLFGGEGHLDDVKMGYFFRQNRNSVRTKVNVWQSFDYCDTFGKCVVDFPIFSPGKIDEFKKIP